jgi:hypothetical protein
MYWYDTKNIQGGTLICLNELIYVIVHIDHTVTVYRAQIQEQRIMPKRPNNAVGSFGLKRYARSTVKWVCGIWATCKGGKID